MLVEFIKVTGKNFMSIGNTPVTLNLNSGENILISGANGSGKSTILNMITYALFGRSYSKTTKTSLVNSVNNKDCLVELYFKVSNLNYKVIRGQKPNKFEIYKDDELIQQASDARDYQQILEDIVKFDFPTYCQTIMLGAASYKPFLELTTSERRSFVESLLEIESFTKMNKALKLKIQKNENSLVEIRANINATKSSINVIENVIKNLNQSNDDAIKTITESIKNDIQQYKQYTEILTQYQNEYDSIDAEPDQAKVLNGNISALKEKVKGKESENIKLQNKIQFFEKNPECSQCGQVVDEHHKQNHIDEYNKEILNNKLLIDKAKEKIQEFESLLKNLTDKIQLKSDKLNNINNIKLKMEYLKKDITKKNLDKTNLENKVDNTLIVEQELQLKQHNIKLNDLDDNCKLLLQLKSKYDKIATSLKDSGAKAEIIKNYVPIISTLVNKYLERLNLYVKFNLDGEFNETLKSRHTDEYDYHSFSLGERTRINLAMLFAWWEITKFRKGINFNIVCFDEVLESVDYDGIQDIVSIISEMENLSCLMISHKNNIDILFDNVINVKKVKGFTRLTT